MFKDYYKILDIPPSSDGDEIKRAYRKQSLIWHPDKNPDKDVNAIMQDINEAYAILKDVSKKARYDQEYHYFTSSKVHREAHQSKEHLDSEPEWTYEYEVQDEDLKEDIKNARKYAKELVDEFMHELKASGKAAVKGAASNAFNYATGWIVAGIIITIIGCIIKSCN